MPNLSTPGERLRYFAGAFFRSLSDFARKLGYGKPGSLYDYFTNTKQPGAVFQDRFMQAGGNPVWLRYGTGSVFADNEAGRELSRRFDPTAATLRPQQTTSEHTGQHEPAQQAPTSPLPALIPYHLTSPNSDEELYLLMNSVFFKMRTRERIAADVLQLYKQVLDNIHQEIDRMEADRGVLARVADQFDNPSTP